VTDPIRVQLCVSRRVYLRLCAYRTHTHTHTYTCSGTSIKVQYRSKRLIALATFTSIPSDPMDTYSRRSCVSPIVVYPLDFHTTNLMRSYGFPHFRSSLFQFAILSCRLPCRLTKTTMTVFAISSL